jgi:hypothetical protein
VDANNGLSASTFSVDADSLLLASTVHLSKNNPIKVKDYALLKKYFFEKTI